MRQHGKPAWWQVYVLSAGIMALLVAAHQWKVTEAVHGTVSMAIVLTGYSLLRIWVSHNERALARQHRERLEAQEGKAASVNEQQARYREVLRPLSKSEHQQRRA